MELIEQVSFDGRRRKLYVIKNTKQSSKKCYAESEKMTAINTSNNTNKLFTSKDVNNNSPKPKSVIQSFVDNYHEICVSLPKVKVVTPKREKSILKILEKYNSVDIITVFTNAENSDFLIGKNDRGWKADIDFILREDKFVAILEGKYGGKRSVINTFGEMEDVRSESYTERELKEMEKNAHGRQKF